jgi:serine/threonine-protein kinase
VIGISKHAAYLVENSSIGTVKKLTSGGGGEVYLARLMKSISNEKTGTLVIQKKIFVKDHLTQEAFYQEVGIMIMLSLFSNFCRIIGYTENPSTMILQYYSGGSLHSWIQGNKIGQAVIMKISKEILSALNVMHSHYLAHCDLKPQNVLIEVFDGIPACYLTDFGITQILSEKILASRAFKVINLRGLSVHYAAPEAFTWFRTKVFAGVDFKNFDIYSFSCIVFELLTKKTPWL